MEIGRIVNVPSQLHLRLRLFDIDIEAGEWKPYARDIPPQIWHHGFEHSPLRGISYGIVGLGFRGSPITLPYLELVDCMGQVYAIVPARLDRCLEMGCVIILRKISNICRCNSISFKCLEPACFMVCCGSNFHGLGVIFRRARSLYCSNASKFIQHIGTG